MEERDPWASTEQLLRVRNASDVAADIHQTLSVRVWWMRLVPPERKVSGIP
jgi:hypothetical protein